MRGPRALAAIGAVAHVICRLGFISEGRFFASEDDPYRAYTAFLIKGDPIRLIGRLWVLGFEACHALVQWAGVPARWAGICVNTLVLAALLIGLLRIMERLAPGRLREPVEQRQRIARGLAGEATEGNDGGTAATAS